MKEQKKTLQLEQNLDADQVAGFLRALADVIAGGCESCLQQYGINLEDFKKIKVGLKKGKGEELLLKIKVKENLVLEKAKKIPVKKKKINTEYQLLKKKMKQTFAKIGVNLNKNTLPAPGIVDDFLRDSASMTGFPGYGDEYYEEYMNVCRNFQDAYHDENVDRLKSLYKTIAQLKKACHDRFK